MAIDSKLAAWLRKLDTAQTELRAQFDLVLQSDDGPRSVKEEINALPGRRIFYNLVANEDFTIAEDNKEGNPLSFTVSQDGSFIMTHYPLVTWKPNAPANATNFGQWSPVSSWPLPAQQNTNQDQINLSYSIKDGGSMRSFNNETAPPLFSRPDALQPLPVLTLFAPSSIIQFVPQFEDILFAAPAVATTGGSLVVALPGYRIIQL